MHVRDLDLNLLRVLDALLRERHVTRAASRIGLSQAATSHALARLRKAFDDPLLVRVGRELRLTPEAERLSPFVGEIMRLVDESLQAPQFDPSTTTATFTLVLPDFLASELLPTLTQDLNQHAPNATLVVQSMSALRDPSVSSSLDAIVLPTDRVSPAEPSIFVGGVRWHGLAADENESVDQPLDLDAFCRLPHLVVHRALVHTWIDEYLEKHHRARNIALRVSNSELIRRVMPNTDLVTIGADVAQLGPGLRTFEVPLELPPLEYQVTWSKRLTEDPASAWFRNRFTQLCRRRLSSSTDP